MLKFVALAVVLSALVWGAGAQAPEPREYPELAGGPGRDLIVTNCVACHSLRVVVTSHMSRDEWDAAITWMQDKHHLWPFTDEDRLGILDYLEATQGPLDESDDSEEPGPWAEPLYPPNPLWK